MFEFASIKKKFKFKDFCKNIFIFKTEIILGLLFKCFSGDKNVFKRDRANVKRNICFVSSNAYFFGLKIGSYSFYFVSSFSSHFSSFSSQFSSIFSSSFLRVYLLLLLLFLFLPLQIVNCRDKSLTVIVSRKKVFSPFFLSRENSCCCILRFRPNEDKNNIKGC